MRSWERGDRGVPAPRGAGAWQKDQRNAARSNAKCSREAPEPHRTGLQASGHGMSSHAHCGWRGPQERCRQASGSRVVPRQKEIVESARLSGMAARQRWHWRHRQRQSRRLTRLTRLTRLNLLNRLNRLHRLNRLTGLTCRCRLRRGLTW